MEPTLQPYFPPPESAGGWRKLDDPNLLQSQGGVDPDRLARAWEYNAASEPKVKTHEEQAQNPRDARTEPPAKSSAVLVVRHGWIVGEWYQNADARTRWNIHSCTKSFTGTAFGMLFDDSSRGRLPGGHTIGLDSTAYDFIPEGLPLTDPRKARITIRHLLTMSSAIKGEKYGIFGVQPAPGVGPFEMALGRGPAANGESAAELAGEPGRHWDYSDAAFAHLSLVFAAAAGMELEEFMERRVFEPIGLRGYSWDRFGPHTISLAGMRTNARDLARFGYLQLTGGAWAGRQLVPRSWIESATRSSQALNPGYGLTWWVNTDGTTWPSLPRDAFAAMGYLGCKCYVVPSLDLVIVRIADGPWPWDDAPFLRMVIESLA
jgi:CubicO group peptidase (beta-lactamase class C family)